MPAAARLDLNHHGSSITHNLQVDRALGVLRCFRLVGNSVLGIWNLFVSLYLVILELSTLRFCKLQIVEGSVPT